MKLNGIRQFFSALRFKQPVEPPAQPIGNVTAEELTASYTDNICAALNAAQNDPRFRENMWYFAQEEMKAQGKILPWERPKA